MRHIIIGLCFFLILGCSSYTHFISSDKKSAIATLHVISIVPQHNIYIQTARHSGANTDMAVYNNSLLYSEVVKSIATGIQAHTANNEKLRVNDWRKALKGLNIALLLNNAFKETLVDVSWADIVSFDARASVSARDIQHYVASMTADAVLVVVSSYSMTSNCERLEMQSTLHLYTRNNQLIGTKKALSIAKHIGISTIQFQSIEAVTELKRLEEVLATIDYSYIDKVNQAKSYKERSEAVNWRYSTMKEKTEKIDAVYQQAVHWPTKTANARTQNMMLIRKNAWLKNNAAMLKEQIAKGVRDLAYLLPSALNGNDDINSITDQAMFKQPVNILTKIQSPWSVEAYKLKDIYDCCRDYIALKRKSESSIFADYYSIPKKGRIVVDSAY